MTFDIVLLYAAMFSWTWGWAHPMFLRNLSDQGSKIMMIVSGAFSIGCLLLSCLLYGYRGAE